VKTYRLLLLDKQGLLSGTETVECREDRDAIAVAERRARKCEYVEVWRGGRPVCMCAKPLAPHFSPWELFRRWATGLGSISSRRAQRGNSRS
jgi:hypothetical protein